MAKCIGGPCDGASAEGPERPDWTRQSVWFAKPGTEWLHPDTPRVGYRYVWHVGQQAWVYDESRVLSETEATNG